MSKKVLLAHVAVSGWMGAIAAASIPAGAAGRPSRGRTRDQGCCDARASSGRP